MREPIEIHTGAWSRALRIIAALTLATAGLTIAPRVAYADVIVRSQPGELATAADRVSQLGGTVSTPLPIVDGFVATLPADRVSDLSRSDSVLGVTPNAGVTFASTGDDKARPTGARSMHHVVRAINADDAWRRGFTGQGVDIALIDTGITPVAGISSPNQVVNGPDLSFDSQQENLRYLDLYGHGTHLAGIIAGRDEGTSARDSFSGVAPGSRIVNVKVGNAVGATDVSQVIAAIDWVVQHRKSNGLNIRVLNLAFNTDSTQSYTLDPLAHAAEVAWRHGIFVVVAAGNNGARGISQPALDPFVVAVGADDTNNTLDVSDDVIPDWSARGNGRRDPDLVAPGRSIASLRVPGSFVDERFPEAREDGRFLRGSGTSQAAAVLSGAAALIIQQRPAIKPDQLKALMTSATVAIPNVERSAQGSGLMDVQRAMRSLTPDVVQAFEPSMGSGSLEASRGSHHVMDGEGNVLTGEQDIFGAAWDGRRWSTAATLGTSWSGGQWNGNQWAGSCWCGTSWSGTSWSGTSWSGTSWSGTSWSGTSWSSAQWMGTSWSGTSWSGTSWSGTSWSGTSWSGTSWSGTSWSSSQWGAGTSWSSEGWG